ncbi:hypothetical protein TWF106_011490 [Orbilia oligospora]|uniref:Uncharacterized protein n=1 Tax=Orbilia oligospora TaxID=2813651 RepID=A0A7C8QE77_ORBOL|nr:hypothetical protein TWF106_011490 [Orbilia oligospora]
MLNLFSLILQISTLQFILSSPVSIYPLENPPELTTPDLNKIPPGVTPNPKKRTPPDGFYTKSASLTCLTIDGVVARWREQSYPSNIGPIRPGDYRFLHNVLENSPQHHINEFISTFIDHCQDCACSGNDIDEAGNAMLRPPERSPEWSLCETQEKANSCMYLFGCTCQILIYQKGDPDVTTDSLFSSLNKPFLPPLRQHSQQRKGRRGGKGMFNPMDLAGITEGNEHSRGAAAESSKEKWLAPGVKEPFWLEGLDEEPMGDSRDWFRGLNGDLRGISGGSGALRKRNDLEDQTPNHDIEGGNGIDQAGSIDAGANRTIDDSKYKY